MCYLGMMDFAPRLCFNCQKTRPMDRLVSSQSICMSRKNSHGWLLRYWGKQGIFRLCGYKKMRYLRVMGSIPRPHFKSQKTILMDRSIFNQSICTSRKNSHGWLLRYQRKYRVSPIQMREKKCVISPSFVTALQSIFCRQLILVRDFYREFCPKTFSTPATQFPISTFLIPLILNATIVFHG